jgi:hypothetical protein
MFDTIDGWRRIPAVLSRIAASGHDTRKHSSLDCADSPARLRDHLLPAYRLRRFMLNRQQSGDQRHSRHRPAAYECGLSRNIPTMFRLLEFVDAGGLIAYGATLDGTFASAAPMSIES